MKRKEEIEIIVDALNRNGLIDPKKIGNVREIVKGALVEIRCRKYAQGQIESPKEMMENIISEMMEEQKKVGKSPLAMSVQISGKEVFKEAVKRPTLEERVSTLEKRLETVKDCVNEGKQIGLFWQDE